MFVSSIPFPVVRKHRKDGMTAVAVAVAEAESEPHTRTHAKTARSKSFIHPRNILGVLGLLAVAAAAAVACAEGQSCDHQAHAVPGEDVTVFDVNNQGYVNVPLDGSLSHSHYFRAGPPIESGVIVSYSWRRGGDNVEVCAAQKCTAGFGVGVTEVTLLVCDQTGDCADDIIIITVMGGDAELGAPDIGELQPGNGGAGGGNKVTINGINFAGQPTVKFGGVEAGNVVVINPNQMTVAAPAGTPGGVLVEVTTVKGTGKGAEYTYSGGSTTVAWDEDEWKNADGSTWNGAKQVTGITLGPDGRYYLSTLVGKVWAVSVGADNVVTSACSGAQFENKRALYGIAWNPKDGANRLLVTSNTMFGGAAWNNGKVEIVNIDAGGCVSKGGVLIEGLPVGSTDHGINKLTFDNNGGLYITAGSATNAGVAGQRFGNRDESPLSGAVLYAPYLSGNFNGKIQYSSNDPGTCRVTGGDVSVHAPGLRNSFGIITSSQGIMYATENGPNGGYGAASTGCNSEEPDPSRQDTLHRIEMNGYYGHPNRNRGRDDERQCAFQKNQVKPIGYMRSSTNGVAEYTANSFNGALKGDLLLSKLARGDARGKVFRVVLDGSGNSAGNPFEIWGASGNQIIQSPQGYLVMPIMDKGRIMVLKPKHSTSRMLTLPGNVFRPAVHAIFPERGHWHGGYRMTITGTGFRGDNIVTVGGIECDDFRFHSGTEISCEVPAGRGTARVIVETEAGVTSTFHGTHDFRWL